MGLILSRSFLPLVNGPRRMALRMLTDEARAEQSTFMPRRLEIDRIEMHRKRFFGKTYTLHLRDGSQMHFDPAKPGLFVLKKDKMYVRALYLHSVHQLDDVVHMLCHPRHKYLHKEMKWLFPLFAAVGIKPHRLGKVFKLDRQTFEQYYQQPKPV